MEFNCIVIIIIIIIDIVIIILFVRVPGNVVRYPCFKSQCI